MASGSASTASTGARRRLRRLTEDSTCGGIGKKACKEADLELEIFHNSTLIAYPGWENKPQPWSAATVMEYVGFAHFD